VIRYGGTTQEAEQRQVAALPGPDWYVVKFDSDGGKLLIHRSMFPKLRKHAAAYAKRFAIPFVDQTVD
jgi:hypothetical protein